MMLKSKYIIQDFEGMEMPVVFSELMNHVNVAAAVGGKTVGAGFCYIEANAYVCYGESVSCKVKSRGDQDSDVLNRKLGVTE